MQKIILDTNILMSIAQLKLDIFEEIDRILFENYQLCIIDKQKEELEKLINSPKLSISRPAKFAMAVLKKKPIKIIKTKKNLGVDDLILEQDAIIATVDKELKQRLKKEGKKIITIKQKKYLVLE